MVMLPASESDAKSRRTRIKICGITSVEMAMAAVEAEADAIGLVHVEHSPRYLLPHQAEEITRALPLTVQAVSVFQDRGIDEVAAWATEIVQLHGHENAEYVSALRQALSNAQIIRALAFDEHDVRRWDLCNDIDALLIEGSAGGTGASFEHDPLTRIIPDLKKPIILAGGLTPNNVGQAIRTVRPFAVDVSSGVETKRGIKDASLIREFCAAVREADRM